jgi:tRNA pseudouridine32 synthase / 23S rRNA pseudouridine746 synthase
MFAPLPEEKAKKECEKLIAELDKDRDQLAGKGAMYGVLVCRDEKGIEVILRAFSGTANGEFEKEGYVPPLFSPKKYKLAQQKNDDEMHELSHRIATSSSVGSCIALREQRKKLAEDAKRSVYELYRFPCIDGTIKTFAQILPEFKDGKKLPPDGTGNCCAPKLFGYAFENKMFPISFAEFYYNSQARSGARVHKEFYTPCDNCCGIVLPAMLGIEILYRDEDIIAVNKPAGISCTAELSRDTDCIASRVQRLFPKCIKQPFIYGPSKEASGIALFAFAAAAQKKINKQIEDGRVTVQYTGKVHGKLEESPNVKKGQTSGKFESREDGLPKKTIAWKKITQRRVALPLGVTSSTEFETIVQFELTALADPENGNVRQVCGICGKEECFVLPITGDSNHSKRAKGETLMLAASRIAFTNPATGKKLLIEKDSEF